MRIASLFGPHKTVFSLEIFPPKRTSPVETIYTTLDALRGLQPDFISVTYGAGGHVADFTTCDIAAIIKDKYGIEPLAHLTCMGRTREDITQLLGRLRDKGIDNVLALRGDPNPELPARDDFAHASDLVTFIRQYGRFHVAGACYPEGHVDARDLDHDIENLCRKVDAGAEHLISQLFFDNAYFYRFMDKARRAGIAVPIEAGIMPVINKKQIERMVTLCGASLPPKFTKMMQRYEHHPEALRDAGIAYAVDQIVDLVAQGVDGIHLYTMNNPLVAQRIVDSVGGLLRLTE